MEAEVQGGQQEFVPGDVPDKTSLPLRMTALIWWLKNGVTCSGGVQKNLAYNSADVKVASSGVHFGAHSDEILRFYDGRQSR